MSNIAIPLVVLVLVAGHCECSSTNAAVLEM